MTPWYQIRGQYIHFLSGAENLGESGDTIPIFLMAINLIGMVSPDFGTTSGKDREGIPNSLLEAMAWGIPGIATRHSGIPEVVEDGVNGLLIDESSPQALARAIARLVSDPGLTAQISRAGQATIAERFTIAACVASLEESYRVAMQLAQSRHHA